LKQHFYSLSLEPEEMPASTLQENKVLLSSQGNEVEIYTHGATITSWKVSGEEQLFLSSSAVLDGTKAIRGGIPLVFPQFGLDPAFPKQQHGFARVSQWTFASSGEDFVTFELTTNEKIRQNWPFDFKLLFHVKLLKESLEMRFTVENLGTEAFNFTCLLHTYFSVSDISNVAVKGLKGVKFEDKVFFTFYLFKVGVTGGSIPILTQEQDEIAFSKEVDRVYFGVKTPEYVIVDKKLQKKMTIKSINFKDVVVWNPWAEKGKSMADLEQDGYKKFVCVEVGTVHENVLLKPKTKWEGGQVLVLGRL
jgi:glucose-6-phosphate 1-epimerase